MFFLDSMLVGGLRFVLDKVATAVDAEMNDETALREQLLDAQMRAELGELSDEAFAAIERDVLDRIRAIRGDRAAGLTMKPEDRIAGVEIDTYEHER